MTIFDDCEAALKAEREAKTQSWRKNLRFGELAQAAWMRYFWYRHSGKITGTVLTKTDKASQKFGDAIVTWLGGPKSIELKTRRPFYYELFVKDRLINIEIMGNIEQRKEGSGFLACQADLWAYGFADADPPFRILEPHLYKRRELAEFVQKDISRYRSYTSQNDTYRTLGILVPEAAIRDFEI